MIRIDTSPVSPRSTRLQVAGEPLPLDTAAEPAKIGNIISGNKRIIFGGAALALALGGMNAIAPDGIPDEPPAIDENYAREHGIEVPDGVESGIVVGGKLVARQDTVTD